MRQYLIITASYWAFTLTDGALRMLVLLHFYQLGFSPLEIAGLFVLYEVFGVITNLYGGWLGARLGLATTMLSGLALQLVALGMLLADQSVLTVAYVMVAQALSGIAKDLNKMSAKSGVKLLVPEHASGQLYRWVAALTGSKNALKGAGYFLGGALLAAIGFRGAIAALLIMLALVSIGSVVGLDRSLGRASFKPKFVHLFAKSTPVNVLAGARLFLFGSRDLWFTIALPVYLQSVLGWSGTSVGALLAIWIIGYGIVQALAPRVTSHPDGRTATLWGALLTCAPLAIGIGLLVAPDDVTLLLVGLVVYGVLFAINSAVHSFLIVDYAERDGVSLDVGFYYMANAAGRLVGTALSGAVYQAYGLVACLFVATAFVALASLGATALPRTNPVEPADG